MAISKQSGRMEMDVGCKFRPYGGPDRTRKFFSESMDALLKLANAKSMRMLGT